MESEDNDDTSRDDTSTKRLLARWFPAISPSSVTYSTCQAETWAAQAPGLEHQLFSDYSTPSIKNGERSYGKPIFYFQIPGSIEGILCVKRLTNVGLS